MKNKGKDKGKVNTGINATIGTDEAGSIAALLSDISQTLKHVDKIVLAIHRSAFALAKRPTPETGSASPETGSTSPETGSTSPETGSTSPETGSTSPETGSASASPSGNLEQ